VSATLTPPSEHVSLRTIDPHTRRRKRANAAVKGSLLAAMVLAIVPLA
jgi:hypothetical protein